MTLEESIKTDSEENWKRIYEKCAKIADALSKVIKYIVPRYLYTEHTRPRKKPRGSIRRTKRERRQKHGY